MEFNDTFTNYYYIQHIFYFIARFCIAFGNPIVPLLCIQFPKINTKKNNNKYNIEYIDYTIAEWSINVKWNLSIIMVTFCQHLIRKKMWWTLFFVLNYESKNFKRKVNETCKYYKHCIKPQKIFQNKADNKNSNWIEMSLKNTSYTSLLI